MKEVELPKSVVFLFLVGDIRNELGYAWPLPQVWLIAECSRRL